MKTIAHAVVSIPDFLAHLETHHGLPVPFTQAVFDGVPDFRAIDPAKVVRCIADKLCAICGRRLGEYCFFIGGPQSRENHLFTDPPMHEECAVFASKTCPFVSGQKSGYSSRPIDEARIAVDDHVSAHRPQTMYMLKTRTKKVRGVNLEDSFVIEAGPWVGQQVIKAGGI